MSSNYSKQVAEDVQSRKQLKKKPKRPKKQRSKKKFKKPRRRIFPIWLRLIVILILCCAALIAGAMVGYGVLGDGAPKDVLKRETWEHIIDIVVKE